MSTSAVLIQYHIMCTEHHEAKLVCISAYNRSEALCIASRTYDNLIVLFATREATQSN